MKRKIWGVALLCVIALLAVAFAFYRRRPAASPDQPHVRNDQPYVGKWKFIEGTKTSDWFYQTDGGPSHQKPFIGETMIVEERNGGFWYRVVGSTCWEMVRLGTGGAELVPGHTECPDGGPQGGKEHAVKTTLSLDPEGRAHFFTDVQIRLERQGKVYEGHIRLDGIAVREGEGGS